MKLGNFALILGAFCLLAATPAPTRGTGSGVMSIQRQYQNLFLQLRGVKLVMTAVCDGKTGELETNYNYTGPVFHCIAVKVNSPADLPAIEAVYPNPMTIDGAVVHFTDKDPIPVRGGITVHN